LARPKVVLRAKFIGRGFVFRCLLHTSLDWHQPSVRHTRTVATLRTEPITERDYRSGRLAAAFTTGRYAGLCCVRWTYFLGPALRKTFCSAKNTAKSREKSGKLLWCFRDFSTGFVPIRLILDPGSLAVLLRCALLYASVSTGHRMLDNCPHGLRPSVRHAAQTFHRTSNQSPDGCTPSCTQSASESIGLSLFSRTTS
jgi:hypothetical protein